MNKKQLKKTISKFLFKGTLKRIKIKHALKFKGVAGTNHCELI